MLDDVEKRLSSLSEVADELNAASDAVTVALRRVEERLATLKLGVEALLDTPLDIPIGPVSEGSSYTGAAGDAPTNYFADQYFLGYGKIAGSWRLLVQRFQCLWRGEDQDCVEVGTDFEGERQPLQRKPLLDSSRDVRLAAVSQVEALLAAIEEAARERINSLNAVIATVSGDSDEQTTSSRSNDGSKAKQDVRGRHLSEAARGKRRA